MTELTPAERRTMELELLTARADRHHAEWLDGLHEEYKADQRRHCEHMNRLDRIASALELIATRLT